MRGPNPAHIVVLAWPLFLCQLATAQEHSHGASGERSTPVSQSAHAPDLQLRLSYQDIKSGPPLPEGVSLDEILDAAAAKPPSTWPKPIHDNPVLSFSLFEQLEYRISDDQRDQFGWEAQG